MAILLAGLALRLAQWGHNRFLEDEALYSYWGLQIATGADPMLDQEPADKPPLHPYLLAASLILFGHNETAARLPSLFASMASIGLVFAIGKELQRGSRPPAAVGRARGMAEWAPLLAALLLALSPFDIQFASTAFTDPLMIGLVLAAILAASRQRMVAAGLLAGLAAASKQQGILFLPLVVAAACWSPRGQRPFHDLSLRVVHGGVPPLRMGETSDSFLVASAKQSPPGRRGLLRFARNDGLFGLWQNRWIRLAVGFGLVAGLALGWDAARLPRPGFVEQGLISYGGLSPIQAGELVPRAAEWLALAAGFWVSPWFNGLLATALAVWLVGSHFVQAIPRPGRIDLAVLAFILAYLAFHWLVGFQVWDRYLLGLVPLVALVGGRAFAAAVAAVPPALKGQPYALGLGVALVACLSGPVVQAANGQLPFGGDHGAYDGIDQLAAYVRAQVPAGAVLYHYWLGYHYRFYLYGAPLRLHWYPDMPDLVHDGTVYRREPRYIAFPSWRDATPARTALANAGISLEPVYQTTRRDGTVSFRLYRLAGP